MDERHHLKYLLLRNQLVVSPAVVVEKNGASLFIRSLTRKMQTNIIEAFLFSIPGLHMNGALDHIWQELGTDLIRPSRWTAHGLDVFRGIAGPFYGGFNQSFVELHVIAERFPDQIRVSGFYGRSHFGQWLATTIPWHCVVGIKKPTYHGTKQAAMVTKYGPNVQGTTFPFDLSRLIFRGRGGRGGRVFGGLLIVAFTPLLRLLRRRRGLWTGTLHATQAS